MGGLSPTIKIQTMNQFVILSFGVDPLNWPSFIEIGEIACSAPAWCTHGLTLKANIKGVLNRLVKTDAMVTSSLVTLLKVLKVVLICQQLSLASHLFCTKVAATDMRGKLRSGQIVFANQME